MPIPPMPILPPTTAPTGAATPPPTPTGTPAGMRGTPSFQPVNCGP
jgi:hypothetical protein